MSKRTTSKSKETSRVQKIVVDDDDDDDDDYLPYEDDLSSNGSNDDTVAASFGEHPVDVDALDDDDLAITHAIKDLGYRFLEIALCLKFHKK